MRKPRSPRAGTTVVVDAVDPGQRRGVGRPARRSKRSTSAARALDLDEDAFGVVADVAGQAELGRQAVHERPEPDALDHAGHPDPVADDASRPRPATVMRLSAPFRPSVTAASRCIRPKL